MKADNVRRLFEIRQKIKELEAEEEALKNEIKEEMIAANTEEALIDSISVVLKSQHRVEVDDEILPYLRENGYSYLIVEKCDQAKFKEMLNSGFFDDDYDFIKDYIKRKTFHYLYLKIKQKK